MSNASDSNIANVGSSERSRELMEELNKDAAEHGVWVRTQANAPAQRPWFTETEGPSGRLSQGKVGVSQTKILPYHWRWNDYEPYLKRLSEIASEAETSPIKFAERQSILLLNPGLNGRLQVTSTIRCAISVYNCGDVAPTHVHSPNASRTILSAKGGYTNVEGEICTAERGDVIVTPNGTWHDHGNDDTEPVIWMDILDWPLLEYLDCVWIDQNLRGGTTKGDARVQVVDHQEGYSNRLYGQGGLLPGFTSPQRGFGIDPDPLFHYKGTTIQDALRQLRDEPGDPYEGINVNLVNPVNGAPLFKTLHYSAQLLRPDEETHFKRETCSTLFVVMAGSGATEVGDERFEWGVNDLFVVPNFLWRRHINTGSGDAILYAVSDAALLRNIGQYRAQGRIAGAVHELPV
jgi:gentisate 1,2-dioxygenase